MNQRKHNVIFNCFADFFLNLKMKILLLTLCWCILFIEYANTNDIGNKTNFEKLKEEYGGNRTFTYILYTISSHRYQHEIIVSLHISEMLDCISYNLSDSKASLLPRLYLQSNNSFKIENRVFNDGQKISYAKLLDCVPDDRVLTSIKNGELCHS